MNATTATLAAPPPLTEEAPYIERDTPAFLRTNIAFLCAGIATFALLYCVQPLMPVFTAEFGVSPAVSSLSLSLPTAAMAVCMRMRPFCVALL